MSGDEGWVTITPQRGRKPIGVRADGTPLYSTQTVSAPRRSLWDRIVEGASDMVRHYSPNALFARTTARQIPIDRDYDAAIEQENARRQGRRPRSSEQLQAERRRRSVESEREWRTVDAGRDQDDPAWRPDGTVVGNVARVGADFVGGMAGAMISDPTNLIAPGGSLIKQMGANAVIGAGADAATQGGEMLEGVRDDYDGWQTVVSGAAGAALPAAVAGSRAVVRGVQDGVNSVTVRNARQNNPKFDELVGTILELEGGGTLRNPKTSPKGAMGPMQVMPETARRPGFGIRPWNGRTQEDLVRVGQQYAAAMQTKYKGDISKVLAAYNAGPGRVDALVRRHGQNWLAHAPKETRNYVKNGLNKLYGDEGGVVEDIQLGRVDEPIEDTRARYEQDVARADEEIDDLVLNDPNAQRVLDEADDSNVIQAFFGDPDYARAVREGRVMSSEDEARLQELIDSDEGPGSWKPPEGYKTDADWEDYLTPAERQEMDASVRPEDVPQVSQSRLAGLGKGQRGAPVNDPREYQVNPKDLFIEEEKPGHYGITYHHPSGAKLTADLIRKGNGVYDIDISGLTAKNKGDIPNGFGPGLTRKLLREIQKRVPDLKEINAERITGARMENPKYTTIKLLKDMLNDDSGTAHWPPRKNAKNPSPNPADPVDRLRLIMERAKPKRYDQNALNTKEYAARAEAVRQTARVTSGEGGYYAELSKLKGAMPKVQFPSIRKYFTQQEIDGLFDMVKNNRSFSTFDRINAREGLSKLFGHGAAGVPTTSQLKLLSEVFPKELIDTLATKRSFKERFNDAFVNAVNLPRTLMSSLDMSAPFRQGIVLVGTKQFWKAFASMFKYLGSEKAFQALNEDILTRPSYKQMRDAGLFLAGNDRFLSQREEAFMSTWADKIPHVKWSQRAYNGFLNKLRADTFDSLLEQARRAGVNVKPGSKEVKDIAHFINVATGRGNLWKLEQAAVPLSTVFFSPRLIAARLAMLNPAFYVKLSPFARKQAIKQMLTFSSIASTVLGLAAAGGADVEVDPRSTDFGKIKVGNTRIDMLGGFGQYLTLFGRQVTGETKKGNGDVKSLTEGKYGDDNRKTIIARFFENKTSPVASYILNLLDGKNFKGEDVNVPEETLKLFLPMIYGDVKEAVEEYGAKGLTAAVPIMFGVGVSTYDSNEKNPERKTYSEEVNEELNRLSEVKGDSILSPARQGKLTDEDFEDYQKLAGKYFDEGVKDLMAEEDYVWMTEEEQIEAIKEVAKVAREAAREEVKSGSVSAEDDGWVTVQP